MSESVIVPGVKVEGKISGNADVRVAGEVYGEIIIGDSSLDITTEGKVESEIEQEGNNESNIKAKNINIAGNCTGKLEAKELVQISSTGKTKGELKTPCLSIEKGAIFSGRIEMPDGDSPSSYQTAELSNEEDSSPQNKIYEEDETENTVIYESSEENNEETYSEENDIIV